MHVLPNSIVKFKEKTMIVVVGQCNVSTQAPGGRGGGQGIPQKTPKTNRMVMQEARSFSNLFQSWKIVILDSFNFMFLSWNPGVSTL